MEKVILNTKREILPLPELYERYSMDIYRYSLSILKDSDDAKDAVQETFVKYVENENTFRGDASQKTWLLVVARNYCFSKLKRADNNNSTIDDDSFDSIYELKLDDMITLQDALKSLTPQQSELLFLKEYANYSYLEIAEITNNTLENVKIKLFRTRQKLRKILEGSL
ncbi:MAG: RNA polymerase sigma-70 factor ECF subfamily [Ignavibacteria bacterium]|nr:MAG: RNA polymerase sigma-70 factor ECF subfamily [Ignavibacteria bacterium]KAF0162475.1 MAG: RNA polymerase sigma-70 factor ECF subfamily [Ignavibacteria bacterium]